MRFLFTRRWAWLALGGALACTGADTLDPVASTVGPRCASVDSLVRSVAWDSMPAVVPAAPTPTRWLLVYAGSRIGAPSYTINQFRRSVTHVDSASQPLYWVFSGAIFLHLYAPSGRVFTTWIGGVPANGDDWVQYLDSLFAPGAALSRLDSTMALANASVGPLPTPFRVSIMIPYPDPIIGTLTFLGATYDFATESGREDAVAAYVSEVIRRFQTAGFQRLKFDGFYWLLEHVSPPDVPLINRVAGDAHAAGLRFLWIPYYDAENWKNWSALGFDAAWLQPNYFFDPSIPAARVESTVVRANAYGMGLEVEFDGRMWVDSMYCDRLLPYLMTLRDHPELRAREISVHDGAGAVNRMGLLRTQMDRDWYSALGNVLR